MEEINRILMERSDIIDVSQEYSSEYETTDYFSPEETENVNTVEASIETTSHARVNRDGQTWRWKPVREQRRRNEE